jgi:hypothetical protein
MRSKRNAARSDPRISLMDYDYFQKMSPEEAQRFLREFLDNGNRNQEAWRATAATDGVALDYSLNTLPKALKWFLTHVHGVHVPLSEDIPVWVRQVHPQGGFEFSEDSAKVVFAVAYYLSECFARLSGMRWAIGNQEFMECNMPVVAGFQPTDELPPLVVVENMYAAILGDGQSDSRIDTGIE